MRISLCLLLFLLTTAVVAQKRLSQTYDAESVKELYINSNEIFEITITAADTDQITVHTIIDGEIFASTLLNTAIASNVLKITTGKTPDYEPFNDKLSAHKVMAIELEITVPVGLNVSVYSTLAGVGTYGAFGQVHMDLGRGHFKGEGFRFRESATINTISGSIELDIDKAHVTAQSRNGTIVISPEITLGPTLKLQSIHGDITIVKSL
ncbi:hypothetical protein [Dokdonia sp. Dokd-P16]|uniref:hypothetical protein n=1 Tax=Dokdonia sp. Dokd-P16 TaxID=2173169 RepID=UPI0013A576E3|nr:hypothetical protein [Dokdonia sp. Dokd-P16]